MYYLLKLSNPKVHTFLSLRARQKTVFVFIRYELTVGAYLPADIMKPVHIDPPEAVLVHKDIRAKVSEGMDFYMRVTRICRKKICNERTLRIVLRYHHLKGYGLLLVFIAFFLSCERYIQRCELLNRETSPFPSCPLLHNPLLPLQTSSSPPPSPPGLCRHPLGHLVSHGRAHGRTAQATHPSTQGTGQLPAPTRFSNL